MKFINATREPIRYVAEDGLQRTVDPKGQCDIDEELCDPPKGLVSYDLWCAAMLTAPQVVPMLAERK